MKNISIKEISSIATTILGAVAAFYAFVAPVWGWPFADEITATATGLATLIATVLGAFTINKVATRKKDATVVESQEE